MILHDWFRHPVKSNNSRADKRDVWKSGRSSIWWILQPQIARDRSRPGNEMQFGLLPMPCSVAVSNLREWLKAQRMGGGCEREI